jgi:hypothetical protein
MYKKLNVLIFFQYMPKKGKFEKRIKFDHSLVFSCIHLLFKIHLNIIITTFLCHGLLLFSTRAPHLSLPQQNRWTMSVDNIGLQICLLGTLNSMFILTFFFLGVN